MPDITIPDAAVEAAARALDANFNPDYYPIMSAMFSDYAMTALTAAAPHIAAAVGELIAKGIEDEWDADVVLHEIHENSREEVWDRCHAIARQFEIEADHG